jgi:chitodextrinase
LRHSLSNIFGRPRNADPERTPEREPIKTPAVEAKLSTPLDSGFEKSLLTKETRYDTSGVQFEAEDFSSDIKRALAKSMKQTNVTEPSLNDITASGRKDSHQYSYLLQESP